MKLSKDLEGHVVTIQLARPLYVMDYAGHMTRMEIGHQGEKVFLAEPVVQKNGSDVKPLVMDLLLGVTVNVVADDHIVVQALTPGGHWSKVTVPTSLIIQVAEVTDFEPTDLPSVAKQVREPAREPLVKL